MIRQLSCAILLIGTSVAFSSTALADAKTVFGKLEGKFKGSGVATINTGGKKVRITCQLTNSYGSSNGKLTMHGKCASSQGSRSVNGAITHSGNQISGTYMAPQTGIRITKSSGKATGNSLVIYSTFFDENASNLVKVNQIIKLTDAGFRAEFSTYDNKTKKYKTAGSLNFKRR